MLYRICRRLLRILFAVFYRLKAVGTHHVPKQGAVILCANHISTFDPPIVGTPLNREVHYMAKAELFDMPILGWLIPRVGAFPVKRGGVGKETIKLTLQILRDGRVMGIFPEGTRKNPSGEGKKGAAMFAIRTGATVIPVSIVGEYKLFRRMTVIYGPPVDLSEFAEGTSEQLEAATDKIMKTIRSQAEAYKKTARN
ncbi:lysophospholipid acyltransferase family protein [Paenibacillus sp. MBLB4367]|uniref:lysophospholipid acyltransferase family protein n=1 Tax=Paenibacillus sp. MBLB4367 TaxID=3384767 RepID=UPI0039081678